MDVLVSLALSNNFGFLDKKYLRHCTRDRRIGPYLTHRIGILCVDILENGIDLPLKLQLPAFQEIETWGINHGEQNAVEARFANFDACRSDLLS